MPRANVEPAIEFSQVPPADPGGPDKLETIAGRVSGAHPGQQIVLFAKSGNVWWVQPLAKEPFTAIRPDSSWMSKIHLGTEYAALLVNSGYVPPAKVAALPRKGGAVVAVVSTKGQGSEQIVSKTLQFSGYEWEIRHEPSARGGARTTYQTSNAWVDTNGRLHLKIARVADGWTCAEASLRRSLGYGSYFVVVRETSQLEPAAVLGLYTWDDQSEEQNHREMNLEISRWGDPASKNAQYAIQPYYVPLNLHRFMTPPGVVTHSFHWEPGRVSFKSIRGAAANSRSGEVAAHVFTSGVPSPGNETLRLSLYVYAKARTPLQNEAEVVIEKFEFLP